MSDLISLKTKGPLFIVGCPRSGTSMLARILASNDHIRMIVGESSFLQLVYGNRLFYGSIHSEKTQRNLKRYLNIKKKAKGEWRMLQFDEWMDNFRALGGDNYIDLYFSLMLTFAQSEYYKHNKDSDFYVGVKNPPYIDFVGLLLAHFPDAKIINIIRDGRASVASMINPVYGYSLTSAALTWNRYMKLSKKIEKQLVTSNYLRVSYERMVTDIIAELKTVCNFLRIPFQQKMLMADLGGLSSFDNINDKNIDTKRIFRFKKILTNEQITLIEHIMEPYLKEYGYLSKEALTVLPSFKVRVCITPPRWGLGFINVVRKYSIFVGISGLPRAIYLFFRNRFKSGQNSAAYRQS